MSWFDALRYDGKRVLVVGGASGMGAAAAELAQDAGAEVLVMDRAPVTLGGVTVIELDLADQVSINDAVQACGAPLDVVLACAGVADGTPGIERINFVGHRYLIDCLLAQDLLTRGSAICFISSTAGIGWEANLSSLTELLDIADFDKAARWMVEHQKADYMGTKQAICAYVAREALAFLQRGVRLNAICPGPTDTPLARAEDWLSRDFGYREEARIEPTAPIEQAYPLLFLCSPAASAITGIMLMSDVGWINAGLTGSFPPATTVANILTGRMPIPPSDEA
jgi:NAD(P)-dependent dehydrogenase (short-subunit alcohol dehydrogenase family)